MFIEQPMTWNLPKALLSQALRIPPANFFDWDPKGVTYIHLIERETGDRHALTYTYAYEHSLQPYVRIRIRAQFTTPFILVQGAC